MATPARSAAENRAIFYQNLIERVRKNQTVDIDGFPSLRTFSEDQQIKEILASTIQSEWARKAVSIDGMSSTSSSSPLDKTDALSLVADLKYRTENHQTPTLLFNPVGNAHGAHVVLVTQVRESHDGLYNVLCIKDNARSAVSNNNCGNSMMVNKETGKIIYDYNPPRVDQAGNQGPAPQVGFCKIPLSESTDAVAQVNSLYDRCRLKRCKKARQQDREKAEERERASRRGRTRAGGPLTRGSNN